jgi:hypothetical protein
VGDYVEDRGYADVLSLVSALNTRMVASAAIVTTINATQHPRPARPASAQ